MFKILLSLLFTLSLFSKEFTIASYNVENLFDLKKQGNEYKEYIPYTKSKWNKKTFNKKLNNLIKVIKDIDADIIALQEIENKYLIQLLLKKLPNYKYYSFSKYKNSSVGIGFLSKIKILENQNIEVKFSNKIYRPILESTFEVENKKFKIFNNHWPSKRSSESYRIKYAKKLFDRVNELPRDYDYILIGDFNSNYNEYETIYFDKKLNDSQGITGINQVLNTTVNKKYITYEDVLRRDRRAHYNLWLDLTYENRFSSFYRGVKQTPDNIILSPALFDSKKISYVKNSFKAFKPNYLYKNKKINRWQMKSRIHQGFGYSDHLPIIAKFSTKKQEKQIEKKINNISQLYEIENLKEDIVLKNVIVIYKNKKNAILKQKNDRAIFLYENAQDLSEGFSYDIKVKKIKNYFGLKEIKKFEIENYNGKAKNYKNLYINANSINILDLKNQNEIITKLKGIYKKRKLYFKNKKIKLYFKNKEDIPKDGSSIIIKRGHLGYYKNQIQIVVYDKSEIDVN